MTESGQRVRNPRRNYRRYLEVVLIAMLRVNLLPTSRVDMSLDTLQALTWDMVCSAVPSSYIELVWSSIQARHRQLQLRQPLCEANQYSS